MNKYIEERFCTEGLKDGTADITRQCWPTGRSKETEADDDEN